jgi:23S rRNA-/tRNA-specific pseudouridylate synthase
MAAPNGGLSDDELDYMIPKAFSLQSQNRVTTEQQLRTATGNPDETSMTHVACHAKILRFRHPMTKKYVTFEADAPF